MDIVICVAYKNCRFLKKNLLFIEENLNPENIYIITKQNNFRSLSSSNKKVKLIDENRLVNGLSFDSVRKCVQSHLHNNLTGWYFQQFLKMGFALSKYANDYYLVWDSDTVPLNKLSFINENGKYLFMPKTEHHIPYFNTIDNLFNAPIKAKFSFISEHMIFDVRIMKELISKIESSIILNSPTDALWFEKCIYAIQSGIMLGFSEFETYGTYCLNYHPKIFSLRTFRTFRRGGLIYGAFPTNKEISSLSNDLDTCSFELYDFPISYRRRIPQWFFLWYCRLRNWINNHKYLLLNKYINEEINI